MKQIKKNPNDPDFDQLNPDLISQARQNKLLKNCIEMFLHGTLTWTQALETMIMLLLKEKRKSESLLTTALKETPSVVLGLPYEDQAKLVKKLPPPPCQTNPQ